MPPPVRAFTVNYDGKSRVLRTPVKVSAHTPNNVRIRDIPAPAMALIDDASDDVLIGMDVIGFGDLAVSNYEGKTSFTFRVPSTKRLDFAAETNRHAGRNDPCPCGSGRKYKKCCGR